MQSTLVDPLHGGRMYDVEFGEVRCGPIGSDGVRCGSIGSGGVISHTVPAAFTPQPQGVTALWLYIAGI